MNIPSTLSKPQEIDYPDSDGQPMADNTLQWEWISTIKNGMEAVFKDDPNVFVAGDLLWYPVEGNNKLSTAPDILVAFGRPKGYRGSYMQWREEGISPQVVFEVLSPSNRFEEMLRKFQFYERYGVEEYYIYNPDINHLTGYLRRGDRLEEIAEMNGWVSPRLRVRFELTEDTFKLFSPEGWPLANYVELIADRDFQQQEKEKALKLVGQMKAQLRSLGVEPPV